MVSRDILSKSGETIPKPAHEVLLDAAGVLRTKGHCKGFVAIDARGHGVDAHSQTAVAFCAIGALLKVHDTLAGPSRDTLNWVISDESSDLVEWNNADARTADEVIAAFDAGAIVAMQEAGIDVDDYLATRETP